MIILLVVTVLSVALALTMSIVAWRIAGEERRRSEARVQDLAAAIDMVEIIDDTPSPVAVNGLLSSASRSTNPTPVYALAAGTVIVGCGLALLVAVTGGPRGQSTASSATPAIESVSEVEPAPLELLSLAHEQQGDGLAISGVVRDRNRPRAGDPLTAVVVALNGEGVVVGSGRGLVEKASAPEAGDVESSFVVRLTGVGDIRRYRVSFRSGDRTLPHVDRRAHSVTAQLP